MNWYVHPLFKSVLSNTVKYISFVKWHIFYQLPIHKTNINELRVTYYRMYVCLVWPFVPLSALMPPLSIIAETLPRWRKLWERERVRWRRRAAEWLYLASTLLWRLFADDSVLLRTRKFNSNILVLPWRIDLSARCLSVRVFFIVAWRSAVSTSRPYLWLAAVLVSTILLSCRTRHRPWRCVLTVWKKSISCSQISVSTRAYIAFYLGIPFYSI